jgi:adenosylcobinamide kinase / adenosylcobinamide-phosphate guanylyltransferase
MGSQGHHPLPRSTLILGGVRSGKSRHGERLVLAGAAEPVLIATAEALDAEMARRIAAHRARRDPRLATVEAPLDLVGALRAECAPGRAVLVDCLTLWLTNLMMAGRHVELETERLVDALTTLPGAVVLVSNEVGQGVMPANAMARAFADHAGALHQGLAASVEAVILMVAGLPMPLKSPR